MDDPDGSAEAFTLGQEFAHALGNIAAETRALIGTASSVAVEPPPDCATSVHATLAMTSANSGSFSIARARIESRPEPMFDQNW